MITVYITRTTGGNFSVQLAANSTVETLKSKIVASREWKSWPSNYQLVVYGQTLQNGKTISQYDIGNETTVELHELPTSSADLDDDIRTEKAVYKKVPSTSKPKSSHYDTSTPSSFSSTPPSNSNSNTQTDTLDANKKEQLLSSFASGSTSSNVEIVFSFDTTGSMSSCLAEVRKKVKETITRLMKDIPKIRIGIIAHGDYCDYGATYVVKKVDLTDDVNALCNFVEGVQATGGGDAPECYELAIRTAREMKWTEGYSKALVVIGDEVPHPPSFTTEKINWFEETDKLAEMGVKIYGIRALHQTHAIPFYEDISERTGAVSIQFTNFPLIVDMFLAICYREASSEKLQQFESEVKSSGKMSSELGNIFKTLSKPNPEKKTEKVLKSSEPWYDITKDNGSPQYTLDKTTGNWKPYSG